MSELPEIENLYRIDGKVCVVTGASSGFGVRFAKVLSAAGAKVVAAARRQDRLQELWDCGDPDSCKNRNID